MNRVKWLAATAALALALAVAAPAHAATSWWPKTTCVRTGESSHLCLDVYATRRADGGLNIPHVYVRTTGGFWENRAFDCDWLALWNDNDVIKWRKDGAPCDVYDYPGYTLFHPSVELPNSASVVVAVAGYPKLDKEQNPGYTKARVTIP